MKNFKRTVSLLLTVCMLFTCMGMTSVRAATPVSEMVEDFDDLSAVTLRSEASNIAPGLFVFENPKGVFGKDANDGAYKVSFNSGTVIESTQAETSAMMSIPSSVMVGTDEYYELSFQYAETGTDTNFEIKAWGEGYPGNSILILASNKIVSVFGTTINQAYGFRENKWFDIRLVVKPSETAATNVWVYVNDVMMYEGSFTMTNGNSFTGIKNLNFLKGIDGAPVGTTYTNTTPPTVYIDNLATRSYAEMPEYDYTIEYNFDNLTNSTDTTAISSDISTNSGEWDAAYIQNPSGAKISGGVYGKAADDKSVYLYKTSEYTDATTFVNLISAGNSGSTTVWPHLATLDEGGYASLELYMAWDGTDDTKSLQAFFIDDVAGDGKSSAAVIKVNTDGTVSAFNANAGKLKLSPGKWYKFNFVMYAGDNSKESDDDKNWFKLYVDNELVIDKTVLNVNKRTGAGFVAVDKFMGFQQIWLASQSEYWGTTYESRPQVQSGTYFDDFTMTYLKKEPVFTAVTPVYSSDYANMALGNKLSGYVSPEIKGATLSVEDADVTITDSNGDEVSAFTGGTDYMRIITADSSKLYGAVRAYTTLFTEKSDFEADDGSLDASGIDTPAKTYTEFSVGKGIAGKEATDSSVVMTTTDVWNDGDVLNPYMQIFNNSNFNYTEAYTYELTLRATGEYTAVNIQFISGTPTGMSSDCRRNFIVLKPDSVVALNGNADMYHSGEWIKVAMTVYPASNKIYAYANGKLMYSGDLWAAGYETADLARIKWEQVFNSNGETDKKSGSLSFDDLKIYNGVYTPETIELSSEDVEIYNDGRVIFTNEMSYIDFIVSDPGFNAINPTLYSDASMEESVSDFEDGAILAVPNDNGDMIKYYYISLGSPCDIKATGVSADYDGTAAQLDAGENSIYVDAILFKSMDSELITFVAAEKSSNELFSVGATDSEMYVEIIGMGDDEYAYPVNVQSGEIVIDIQKDHGESNIELFMFDSETVLKPISDKTVISR